MLVNHLPVRYKEPLSRNHSHGHKWIYHPKIVSISIAILQFRCPRMMVKKTIIRGHSSFHPHVVGNSCGIICRTIFYFPCDSESASKKACSLRRALKQRCCRAINFFIHRFCLPKGGEPYINTPLGNPPFTCFSRILVRDMIAIYITIINLLPSFTLKKLSYTMTTLFFSSHFEFAHNRAFE